jgi:CheY-like chemotaxis protein
MQKRALIVDDERSDCELLERALVTAGVEPVSVNSGAEALGSLRNNRFVVVFLDYRMAFPDGVELTRQARDSTLNRRTPIVLISDDQHPTAMNRGFDAGASFFLYKPLDKDRVVRLLRATQGAIQQAQRRTRRVALHSKVLLRYRGQEIEGETLDVSMEGLLIRSQSTIPVGSSVDVSLHLSQTMSPIVGVGSVVRLDGPDKIGVQLGRLRISESQRLQEFLLPLIPGEL